MVYLIQRRMFTDSQYTCRECGKKFLCVHSDLRPHLPDEFQAGADWANFNLFCSVNCLKNYSAYHEYLESFDSESDEE